VVLLRTPARGADAGAVSTRTPASRAAVAALPGCVAGRRASSALTAALAADESHHPPLPSVPEVVLDSAAGLNRYPDPARTDLRERLARHLGASPDEIAVGPGSVGVLTGPVAAAGRP
jgi:histidinol-phosphate aminotransferase